MNDSGKQYHVRREAEEEARHVMGAVVVILLSCVLGMALAGPLLYTMVCHLRGC